jgi:hypothetical protein
MGGARRRRQLRLAAELLARGCRALICWLPLKQLRLHCIADASNVELPGSGSCAHAKARPSCGTAPAQQLPDQRASSRRPSCRAGMTVMA